MTTPDVAVAIPTWRRPEWLGRCLTAVAKQSPAPRAVIVIGRAEDTEARELTERVGASWLAVDRPGHIAPVDVARERLRTRWIAFLDDDAEPEESWLAELLEPLGQEQVACVGGRVIEIRQPEQRARRDAGRIRWYGEHAPNVGAREGTSVEDVDGVPEGNWVWRSDVLRRLDLDPVLDHREGSMYGLDLCLQAKALGYRVVYTPMARVKHHAAPRDPAYDREARAARVGAYTRNYTYIALKHFTGFRRIAFIAWWWLLGDGGSYGLLRAPFEIGRKRRVGFQEVVASAAGRRAGTALWRASA
jgi:GT2 family glycosyltransferase